MVIPFFPRGNIFKILFIIVIIILVAVLVAMGVATTLSANNKSKSIETTYKLVKFIYENNANIYNCQMNHLADQFPGDIIYVALKNKEDRSFYLVKGDPSQALYRIGFSNSSILFVLNSRTQVWEKQYEYVKTIDIANKAYDKVIIRAKTQYDLPPVQSKAEDLKGTHISK